jgi:hypothetical protein
MQLLLYHTFACTNVWLSGSAALRGRCVVVRRCVIVIDGRFHLATSCVINPCSMPACVTKCRRTHRVACQQIATALSGGQQLQLHDCANASNRL